MASERSLLVACVAVSEALSRVLEEIFVRFQVLTAASMMMAVFLDVALCSFIEIH
jgi:hypothetical protein